MKCTVCKKEKNFLTIEYPNHEPPYEEKEIRQICDECIEKRNKK